MFFRIILGIIGVFIGALIIKYREKIQGVTGSISFAEKYLGSGGTFTFFVFLGVLMIFISIFHALGLLDDLLLKIFGRLL